MKIIEGPYNVNFYREAIRRFPKASSLKWEGHYDEHAFQVTEGTEEANVPVYAGAHYDTVEVKEEDPLAGELLKLAEELGLNDQLG